MSYRSDNPVRDAEYAAIDMRPVHGYCEECGCALHSSDGIYESDVMYLFDGGEFICESCLHTYCNKHFRI